MKKSDSLYYMQSLGFNTLDCFITKEFLQAKAYLENHLEDKMSIRTERGDEFQCPFYYAVKGEDLIPIAKKHIDEGYKLLIYPYLDYKDSLAYGTIAILRDGSTLIEWVNGSGLVRDLDTNPEKITAVLPPGLTRLSANKMINEIIVEVRELLYHEVDPLIVEWSLYKYPVGILQHNVVYWELRNYE